MLEAVLIQQDENKSEHGICFTCLGRAVIKALLGTKGIKRNNYHQLI